jgi:hypothetical protein
MTAFCGFFICAAQSSRFKVRSSAAQFAATASALHTIADPVNGRGANMRPPVMNEFIRSAYSFQYSFSTKAAVDHEAPANELECSAA